MLKHTLIASILALTLTPLAHAKVTYEDAVQDQSAYNAKIKALAPPPAVGYTSGELDGIESTTGDWTQIYTGNTIGRVNIPSNAKMIMVQTSEGTSTFPINSGSLTLASVTSKSENCGLTATANARFTGSQVMGEESRKQVNCGGHKQSDQKWGTAYAKVSIQKVLIQN
ncbi:hypothetical protein [Aliivibrio salmonicida]|uniref:hypothetical protein n=1 Tax=Aliivibrio salmonicida TaxID=40269 RepID=UPI003D0FB7F5